MRILLIVLLHLSTLACLAQRELSVAHEQFLALNEETFLVLDGKEGLRLIDSEGIIRYRYSEGLMADITSVDLSTSMRPMLFFGDIPAFQLLDNTLSPQTSPIELQDIDMPDVSLACAAVNNGYWVYDAVAFELRRLDDQLNVQVQSGGLNVVLGYAVAPNKLCARNNRLYLNDPTFGIHVFDFYGGYLGLLLAQSGITHFDVRDNRIVYATEEGEIHQSAIFQKADMLGLELGKKPVYKTKKRVSSVNILGESIHVGDGEHIFSFEIER